MTDLTEPAHDPARCIPILPSLAIGETRAFYAEHLGFAVESFNDDYLIARRDAMEVHYWLTTDRALCEVSACYIRGGQVPALFQEFTARKVPGLCPSFAWRPWGMKEFYIRDPHGNLLKFGCGEDSSE